VLVNDANDTKYRKRKNMLYVTTSITLHYLFNKYGKKLYGTNTLNLAFPYLIHRGKS
jgi:hypothetical protein